MKLDPVPKVLPLIRKKCQTVIGFKAESGLTTKELVARARSRIDAYGLSAVIANDIDSAGKSSTSVIIVTKDSQKNITYRKDNLPRGTCAGGGEHRRHRIQL